jgi:hypothetical protein
MLSNYSQVGMGYNFSNIDNPSWNFTLLIISLYGFGIIVQETFIDQFFQGNGLINHLRILVGFVSERSVNV